MNVKTNTQAGNHGDGGLRLNHNARPVKMQVQSDVTTGPNCHPDLGCD